jgi:hypothetical protein
MEFVDVFERKLAPLKVYRHCKQKLDWNEYNVLIELIKKSWKVAALFKHEQSLSSELRDIVLGLHKEKVLPIFFFKDTIDVCTNCDFRHVIDENWRENDYKQMDELIKVFTKTNVQLIPEYEYSCCVLFSEDDCESVEFVDVLERKLFPLIVYRHRHLGRYIFDELNETIQGSEKVVILFSNNIRYTR